MRCVAHFQAHLAAVTQGAPRQVSVHILHEKRLGSDGKICDPREVWLTMRMDIPLHRYAFCRCSQSH